MRLIQPASWSNGNAFEMRGMCMGVGAQNDLGRAPNFCPKNDLMH